MQQVEKLSIEIEATNNVAPGLKSAQDDLSGFQRRVQDDASVRLALNLSGLQLKKREAEQELKAFKANGDRLGQISVGADIAILKQRIAQAQRELTNFSRTGQRDVSVLGRLFVGVGSGIGSIGTGVKNVSASVVNGVSGMAIKFIGLEKIISFARNSLAVFNEESGRVGGNAKALEDLNGGWRQIQYTVGSAVSNVFERFFALFGDGVKQGTANVNAFAGSVIGGMQKAGAAARGFATFLAEAIAESATFVTEAFKMLPQAAEASFGFILTKLDGFVQDWAQGVKTLTFGKLDITGDVGVPNPFKDVDFPDFGRKFSLTTKMIGTDWDFAVGGIKSEWDSISTEIDKRSQESAKVRSKAFNEASKSAADAAKKQAKEDEDSRERVRKMTLENVAKEAELRKQKQKELKAQYLETWATIGAAIDKNTAKVKDFDEQLAELGKERTKQFADTEKALAARFVEVDAAIKAGSVDPNADADQLNELFRERAYLVDNTTAKVRNEAAEYEKLTEAQRIMFDRNLEVKRIDAEIEAVKLKRDEELAAIQAVTDLKVQLEKQYTAVMGEEIAKQMAYQDQLVAKLQEVERAARAAAAAKTGAGVSNVTNNNVSVTNQVTNAADAQIVADRINNKLSR
jgi:hypothetical protein